MMMVLCSTSVYATDHMPPNSVYRSTTPVPMTMPQGSVMAPPESVWNTTPSAVNCADSQPR